MTGGTTSPCATRTSRRKAFTRAARNPRRVGAGATDPGSQESGTFVRRLGRRGLSALIAAALVARPHRAGGNHRRRSAGPSGVRPGIPGPHGRAPCGGLPCARLRQRARAADRALRRRADAAGPAVAPGWGRIYARSRRQWTGWSAYPARIATGATTRECSDEFPMLIAWGAACRRGSPVAGSSHRPARRRTARRTARR